MKNVLAFDVYGTLIDPMGVVDALREILGEDAPHFARLWRNKQVEYLFRRGLGRKYQPFSVCTGQALEHTCLVTGHALSSADRDRLLSAYLELPAYDDVCDALCELKGAGFDCYAFSNGEADALGILL
ncbi:MAG: haloacid dehalogenase type II, partial [Gammaproteobacteria bacterium]|nr:haloacid dehalogenase type II [Gammaproteobacteria bacterium]